MYKEGKTSLSNDSPDFFHIPKVPILRHQERFSHKTLKPMLKLSSSLENPLNKLPFLPKQENTGIKPKMDYQQFSFKQSLESLKFSHSQLFDLLSDKRPTLKNKSEYFNKYSSLLQSTGFGIASNMSSSQFDTPRILRNESEKLKILKNKKNFKSLKIFEKQNIQKKIKKVVFFIDNEKEKKNFVKETQLSRLVKEIQEFENKLKDFKESAGCKIAQQDIYKTDKFKKF